MIKHPASRSLCSLTSPILLSHHHTLPTATSRFHFDQLQALPWTPPSRHNCEVSTPAERRADHSQALTIVNRSTFEKVHRNLVSTHRISAAFFEDNCKVLPWMVVTNRYWVDRTTENIPSKVKEGRSTFRHYNLQLVSPAIHLFHLERVPV
jgi:hypothetical protein